MLIPILDRVLVLAFDDPDEFRHGFLVLHRPDSTKDRSDQGIVKAVGPLVKDIRVGDYITFNPYSGTVVDDEKEGKKHILLAEEACISIVTPPSTPCEGLFVLSDGEYIPATMEAVMIIARMAYHRMPRVIEQQNKFAQRFGA